VVEVDGRRVDVARPYLAARPTPLPQRERDAGVSVGCPSKALEDDRLGVVGRLEDGAEAVAFEDRYRDRQTAFAEGPLAYRDDIGVPLVVPERRQRRRSGPDERREGLGRQFADEKPVSEDVFDVSDGVEIRPRVAVPAGDDRLRRLGERGEGRRQGVEATDPSLVEVLAIVDDERAVTEVLDQRLAIRRRVERHVVHIENGRGVVENSTPTAEGRSDDRNRPLRRFEGRLECLGVLQKRGGFEVRQGRRRRRSHGVRPQSMFDSIPRRKEKSEGGRYATGCGPENSAGSRPQASIFAIITSSTYSSPIL
jgi:hypothetical protein